MKKLLSILMLLVGFSIGAWADDVTLFTTDFTESGWSSLNSTEKAQTLTIGTQTVYVRANNAGNLPSVNTTTGTLTWGNRNFSNKDCYIAIPLSGVNGKITFSVANGTSNTRVTYAVSTSSTVSNPSSTTNTNSAAPTTATVNVAGDFCMLYIGRQGSGLTQATSITITTPAPAAPTITAQPQGAAYVTGSTATDLSVTATASAGDLSYQWYSNTTATNTGGTLISGATDPSYAPSTDVAGTFYYYCVVTDDNGSTPSDVATIVVSAASAPTINVSGAPAEPVKVGTAVTLTAEVTGMPAPTIQWYSNTTASTSGGTVIEGATEETYSPSTATAGTYYYFAQAVNTEGNALSAVQTIVVQEQVKEPTITPGSKHFTSSVTMTASSETEDASFKYSIDGGVNWADLPNEGVEITETKTVQVKATKTGYIDSDVATATYTKYAPTELATISEATTWDFANLDGGVQYPADDRNTEFVYTDIEGVSVKDGKTFNTGALAFMGEYPLRSGKGAAQNGTLHFKTTVSGAITVTFSDTGNSGDNPKRYLNVNGVNSEYYTQRTGDGNDKQSDKVVAVPAGDVTITGMGEDGTTPRAIMVYKLVFTPDVPVVVTSAEWASTTTPNYAVEFGEGAKAYIATSSEGDKIKLTQITDAPAKTAIIVNAPTGTYKLIKKTTAKSDVTGNLLKSKTANNETAAVGDYALGTWIDGGNTVVGFGKLNAAGVDNMTDDKAFIPASLLANAVDFLPFVIGDEENETTSINSIENGELRIENSDYIYNLAGQKVSKDYKGIVIVNGKKFVRK